MQRGSTFLIAQGVAHLVSLGSVILMIFRIGRRNRPFGLLDRDRQAGDQVKCQGMFTTAELTPLRDALNQALAPEADRLIQ
jgi:hypothetical protein